MSYDSEVLADAPNVYLKLNEPSGTSATDSSGASRTGTYAGGVTLGAAGPFGAETAADFDGVDGRVSYPCGTFTGSAAFSVECWARFDTTPTAAGELISSDGYIWELHLNAGTLIPQFLGTGPSADLNLNQWYHIVGTYAGGTGGAVKLYVDGAQSGGSGTTTSSSFSAALSGRRFDGYGAFDGKIAKVAIYPTELSAARVAAHFAAASGGGDTTPPTLGSLAVPSGGVTLAGTLSESGCIPASGTGGFTLAGTSATVASWAISGTTLTLTLSGTVYSGQTVTLSYARAATTNDISDASSNYLADFSAAAVTNGSTQAAPAGGAGGLFGASALVSF